MSKGEQVYSFSDVWDDRAAYLEYMRVRLVALKRVLKPTGSIFLHCDTYASAHLRILLEEVFGEDNFRSEIIWAYKRWSNSAKSLLPAHQTIFYFSKTKDYKFNPIYTDYSPTTNLDQILQDRERNEQGKAVYKKDATGKLVIGRAKQGVALSDVWEIPFLNPKAKERTGSPTQKPIELLDRIIKLVTDEGDLVLDPCCGSGTTLVAAKLLNRRYLGIDKNQQAVELTKSRLDNPIKTTSNLLKVGADAYKTKSEADLALLKQLGCDVVQRNKGIDGLLKRRVHNAPVALKIHHQGENLADSIQLLDKAAKSKGCSFSVLVIDQLSASAAESATIATTEQAAAETALANKPANMLVLHSLATNLQLMLDQVERLVQAFPD